MGRFLRFISAINRNEFGYELYPVAQSAYRRNHSTETALLKVMNDFLLNMNKQHVTILFFFFFFFFFFPWTFIYLFFLVTLLYLFNYSYFTYNTGYLYRKYSYSIKCNTGYLKLITLQYSTYGTCWTYSYLKLLTLYMLLSLYCLISVLLSIRYRGSQYSP